jgi:protein phosphatase
MMLQSERRNIILQALGPEPTVKVDLTHQRVRRGDTLVLCSDGLSGQVTKEDIAGVVGAEPDLMTACKRLIDLANANGGPDNITVIVARFEGEGLEAVNGGDAVGHRVFPLPETGQTPAIALERVMDPEATTQPVPIQQRPTPQRTTRPLPADDLPPPSLPPSAPSAPAAFVPPVSDRRRSIGLVVRMTLLVAFVLALGLVAWRLVSRA